MPTYNPYTKTNDQPIITDAWTNVFGTPRPPRVMASDVVNYPGSKYYNIPELVAVNMELKRLIDEWVKKHNIPQDILDQWAREAVANKSQEDQRKWWQKIADKVSNTVNNFISNAGNVLQQAGENVALAPLLPFKLAMVNALKRKGENVSMSTKLGTVSSLFKQKIIDRSSTTNYLNHAENDKLTTNQILELIDKIIPFFTMIIQKIKGGTATAEEKLINSDAESEASRTTSGGAPTVTGVNAPVKNDNWFLKYKWIIIGTVAVVLFLAFRKKK